MQKTGDSNAQPDDEHAAALRQEVAAQLREHREPLRSKWVHMMAEQELLTGLTEQETEAESAAIYDTCVTCLETQRYDEAEAYASRMAERGVLRGMTTRQILGGLLVLRDVFGQFLREAYVADPPRVERAHGIYEPVAREILSIVAMAFLEERSRVITLQQEAIRELSTPVLQLRDGILLLPIVGMLDSNRAYQLTEQLLLAIRNNRARAVIVDITGVPTVDSRVANHLLQTTEAARLMGTRVVVTGVSPQVAVALVSIGVDLRGLETVGDLLGGIERADQIVGYRVIKIEETVDAGNG